MIRCPYCGNSNYDNATECRKCQASFVQGTATTSRKPLGIVPEKAHAFRNRALAAIILGILIKVYWGGYGPWPVIDNPTLAHLRAWVEPLLLFGGIVLYLVGWVMKRMI